MFSSRPLRLLRFVVCLTLLGFAVTVLIGPALAVAGVLLPFALVGGLTWGAYRFSRRLVRRIRAGRSRFDAMEVASPHPIPVVFRPAREERPASRRQSRFGSMLRTAVYVGVEVACGAALGAALSILADWQTGTGIEFPALGVAIGAVVGFVVGGTRSHSAAEASRDEDSSAVRAA